MQFFDFFLFCFFKFWFEYRIRLISFIVCFFNCFVVECNNKDHQYNRKLFQTGVSIINEFLVKVSNCYFKGEFWTFRNKFLLMHWQKKLYVKNTLLMFLSIGSVSLLIHSCCGFDSKLANNDSNISLRHYSELV